MDGKIVFLNTLSKRKIFKTKKHTFSLKHGNFSYDLDSNFSFSVKIEDVEKIVVEIYMINGSGEKQLFVSQKLVNGMHFCFEHNLNNCEYKFEFIFK